MFPESHGFAAMPVTSCVKDTRLVKGDEIVRPCDRHSRETVTLRKHVTKYKKMRKWMVDFFRKGEHRGIKIARVNSIGITKSINLL